MDIKLGPVAFIDILGYKSLIENNDLENIKNIINRITDIVPLVNEHIKALTNTFSDVVHFSEIHCELEYQIVSDSIIVTKNVHGYNESDKFLTTLAYIIGLVNICHLAFKEGIPIRGAINYGEYIFNGNTFASKAIIAAYEDSNLLNFFWDSSV